MRGGVILLQIGTGFGTHVAVFRVAATREHKNVSKCVSNAAIRRVLITFRILVPTTIKMDA